MPIENVAPQSVLDDLQENEQHQVIEVQQQKVRRKKRITEEELFGSKNDQAKGRKHFILNENDRVGHILEHPLSHYTSSNGEESQKSDRRHRVHKNPEERQRIARRQVMSTEYQRTINKSAERHKNK